jgi:hypothetical protein
LSELTPLETKQKLLAYFHENGRFDRLMEVIATEPPRVRAMVGAIGQEIGEHAQSLMVYVLYLDLTFRLHLALFNSLQQKYLILK